jgi:hypothetical protein
VGRSIARTSCVDAYGADGTREIARVWGAEAAEWTSGIGHADIDDSQPACIDAQYKTEGRHEDPRKTTVDADTRGARR